MSFGLTLFWFPSFTLLEFNHKLNEIQCRLCIQRMNTMQTVHTTYEYNADCAYNV